jgi:hypothetical protein
MPAVTALNPGSTRTTVEEFLVIVCADPELLRAEFDAIVAAEWPSPPSVSSDAGDAPKRSRRAAQRRQDAGDARPCLLDQPGVVRWSWERSPPAPTGIADRPHRR